jgi:hypothetical protein
VSPSRARQLYTRSRRVKAPKKVRRRSWKRPHDYTTKRSQRKQRRCGCVSASAGRRRRKRRLGNSQLLGRSNNINAASQPYKNLTIHITKVNEQSHTTPTKSHQSVVELWLLQARLLRNLRRHLLPLKPPRAAAKLEFWRVCIWTTEGTREC